MKFGVGVLNLGFLAAIISMILYFLNTRAKQKNTKKKKDYYNSAYLKQARFSYYSMVTLIIMAVIYLYYLILTHNFQVKYVYQYSSRDLSLGLLISTFWAGQQGSFLLWAFFTAIMGLLVIKYAKSFESYSMLFLNIVMAFFLLLLIQANPFELLPKVMKAGLGLNPLLQNFWMVIHPPILFLGYATITIPFILALASLAQKEYESWIKQAFPWTVFSTITLGAGIIIGAFWAYETLGWGGYWGWDPVENSSLIPWLTILALLHGLIIQKRNGTLRKTNYIFAILSFILVLYATFLTRSGVLADFSVHSFSDLGINAVLIVNMITIIVISSFIFLLRKNDIKTEAVTPALLNKEIALIASLWVFAASAFLIFIGTSSPIITGILGDPSQVESAFYNKVNLPVGIVLALLLGVTPFLLWVEDDLKSLPKRLLVPVLLAFVSTIIVSLFGLQGLILILFVFAAFFALWSNCIVLLRKIRNNWLSIASPLAHFGVGVMFIGIIVSGNFSVSKRVLLDKGVTAEVLDYQLTYKQYEQRPDGKNRALINVYDGKKEFTADPRLFSTNYNNEVMREPYIDAGLLSDLYISPLERRTNQTDALGSVLSILKGQTKQFAGMDITFTEFEMSNHETAGHFKVGAVLEIAKDDQKFVVKPAIIMGSRGKEMEPALLPSTVHLDNADHPSVILAGLNADEKSIQLIFHGLPEAASPSQEAKEQLVVEVSKKPFMSILWFGSILVIIGTIIAFKNRLRLT